MKKLNKLNYLFFPLIAAFVIAAIGFTKQDNSNNSALKELLKENKTVSQVIAEKRAVENFRIVKPFKVNENVFNSASKDFASGAVILEVNKEFINDILTNKYPNLLMEIPYGSNHTFTLELTRIKVVSDDFKLYSVNNGIYKEEKYEDGVHYNGIIKGDEKSMVSINIYKDRIDGIICNNDGNYNFGPIGNIGSTSKDYIFYNDANIYKPNPFKCRVEGELTERLSHPVSEEFTNKLNGELPILSSNFPVKVFYVGDYRIYLDGGSNINVVANYINGFHAHVKTIYQNENVGMDVGSIAVYTSPDPFIGYGDTYPILLRFASVIQNNMNNCHIAHLVSTRTDISGGIANIRSLCKPYNPVDSSGSYAFSVIHTSYQPYPVYSWTVLVVAHEMGHNVGSRHTHACIWPGGPIDTCIITPENSTLYGFPEGCIPLPQSGGCYRTANGTVMSYCHFCNSTNLANNFGPMPGDTIRLRFAQAQGCLIGIQSISSEVPSEFSLKQNYPNPFNPVTNIKFDIKKASFVKLTVIDVSGKTVAVLVSENMQPGSYNYDWNAEKLASGVYFYKLEADGFSDTKKMVLVK